MMKKLFSFCLAFIWIHAFSQSMQYPPSVEWFKIKTNFGEIVYPKPLGQDALRIGRLLEAEQTEMNKTMPTKLRKISIFFNNQLSYSNAYVGLAPYQSVWYGTPPQEAFNGTLDWYETLAKHEFRHVYQFNRLNRNLNKFLYFLYGEYGQGAASGLVPNWFFEGDAVLSETLLSHSGRGRLAEFDMPIRTNYLNGIKYSYYKATLGSNKDYVANHYYYGYLYTTYLRRKLGADGVDKVLEHSTKRTFWPFAFNLGLKKMTNKAWDVNFNDMINDVGKQWAERQAKLEITSFEKLNKRSKRCYTSYSEPAILPDSSIICKKSSRKQIQKWVIVKNDGSEQPIGNCTADDGYSLYRNRLVFTEQIPNARWGQKSSSDIFELNAKTGKKRRITHRQRYYSPAYSPDGKTLVAMEYDDENHAYLVSLDRKTGNVKTKAQIFDNQMIRTPVWVDQNTVALIHGKSKGFALSLFSLDGKQIKNLIPYSNFVVSQPYVSDNYLYYHSDETGIDNLFAINLQTGTKFQVSSAAYGAFHPYADPVGHRLLYQNYSAKGYNLAQMPLDSTKWIKSEDIKKNPVFYFEPLLKESNQDELKIDTTKIFKETKYRAWSNLINIHSWYAAYDGADVFAGFLSDNKLNTLSINPELTYNTNEKSIFGSVDLKYSKYFLVLDGRLATGARTVSTKANDGSLVYHSFNEDQRSIGLQLPLNLSRNSRSSMLTTSLTYLNVERGAVGTDLSTVSTLKNGTLKYLMFRLNFSNVETPAPRDVFSKWAQTFQLSRFAQIEKESALPGSFLYFSSTFNLPGLVDGHSLRFNLDYEQQVQNFFASQLLIRGYSFSFQTDSKQRLGVNYAFPLLYPDMAMGACFYLRRVAINLFSDFGQVTNPVRQYQNNGSVKVVSETQQYNSMGAEFMFSFNLLNLPYPIHTGLRMSYRQLDKQLVYDILPISISF